MSKKLFVLLSVIMVSFISISCKKEIEYKMEEISDETLIDMKEAYYNLLVLNNQISDEYSAKDIYIRNYYGKFGNSYALIYSRPDVCYPSVGGREIVAGIPIESPSMGLYIYMYNNGNVYRLQEAYDKGLMDEDSLFKLRAIYKHTTEFYDDFKNHIEENKYGKK